MFCFGGKFSRANWIGARKLSVGQKRFCWRPVDNWNRKIRDSLFNLLFCEGRFIYAASLHYNSLHTVRIILTISIYFFYIVALHFHNTYDCYRVFAIKIYIIMTLIGIIINLIHLNDFFYYIIIPSLTICDKNVSKLTNRSRLNLCIEFEKIQKISRKQVGQSIISPKYIINMQHCQCGRIDDALLMGEYDWWCSFTTNFWDLFSLSDQIEYHNEQFKTLTITIIMKKNCCYYLISPYGVGRFNCSSYELNLKTQ